MRDLINTLRIHRHWLWLALVAGCSLAIALGASFGEKRHRNLRAEDFKSLQIALDVIERSAYYSDRIDWPVARSTAFSKAEENRAIDQALNDVLRQLGDSHSMYLGPEVVGRWDRDPRDAGATINSWNRNGITYVSIPTFNGTSETSSEAFAAGVRAALITPDSNTACGWIVDLRENRGGNMAPMLQGVEALIGTGVYFHWEQKQGLFDRWFGSSSRVPAWKISQSSTMVLDPRRPLAVLQGPRTASAGELLLISLRGRPNTRTFGEGTAGKPSGNEATWLPNGGVLALTIALASDRSGKLWIGPIPADEHTPAPSPPATGDATLESAERWIRSFACPSKPA